MRRLVALSVAVALGCGGVAEASFSRIASASQAVAAATLDAPGSAHCGSVLGISGPVTLLWTAPAAVSGKSTTPLHYRVERRTGSGSWVVLTTTLTATTYSDNPSGTAPSGTTFSYRITATYSGWTSAASGTVSATYALGGLLGSCLP